MSTTAPTDRPALTRQLTADFDDYETFMTDDIQESELANLTSGEVPKVEPHTYAPMEVSGAVEMKLLTGVATDIGGGKENQDKAMLFWTGEGERHLVMGVFDGHGRELGELAAIVSRDYMKEKLMQSEYVERLAKNPKEVFDELFLGAHNCIRDQFKKKFNSDDWDIVETAEGYLTKQSKRSKAGPHNINGGTTATVVVILDGWRMLVANVGDSTALFGGVNKDKPEFIELSAEHSPESTSEFKRVRAALPSRADPKQPNLRFVYDVFDRHPRGPIAKHQCPPIFSVDQKDPDNVKCNNMGYYYKNVRSEWATLVTTPPSARFQDALAFTRSLGDLHLHVYGVSHVPEVKEFNLNELHEPFNDSKCSVIFVCTDGVWDNWKYDDIVTKTLTDEYVVPALTANDAQPLTEALMQENIKMARANFGSQADNMTGIVCLVQSPTQALASQK